MCHNTIHNTCICTFCLSKIICCFSLYIPEGKGRFVCTCSLVYGVTGWDYWRWRPEHNVPRSFVDWVIHFSAAIDKNNTKASYIIHHYTFLVCSCMPLYLLRYIVLLVVFLFLSVVCDVFLSSPVEKYTNGHRYNHQCNNDEERHYNPCNYPVRPGRAP